MKQNTLEQNDIVVGLILVTLSAEKMSCFTTQALRNTEYFISKKNWSLAMKYKQLKYHSSVSAPLPSGT